MQVNVVGRRKPAIVVGRDEHGRLYRLASAASDRMPAESDELLAELDRARLVPDAAVPADVVRMGSQVEFRSDNGAVRRVALVYPEEADIAEGKVSVLTPIGAALIGLRPGHSMTWQARDGRPHELTVLAVWAPVLAPVQGNTEPAVQAAGGSASAAVRNLE